MNDIEYLNSLVNDEELNKLVRLLLADYRLRLTDNGVNASGKLASTADYHLSLENSSQTLAVYFDLEDYYKYIEYGRPPGKMPPIEAIESWIKIKPVVPRTGKNGKIPTTKQLAWAIAKNIAKKGNTYYQMGGAGLLRDNIELRNDLISSLAIRISEIFQEEINKEIDKIYE